MADFRTTFPIAEYKKKLNYEHHLAFIGSCFTENFGNILTEYKFKTLVNPFGIVYNPISIAQTLQRILHKDFYTENDLIFYNEQWHSFDHHGKFSNADKSICIKNINANLLQANVFLHQTHFLFITLGSSWVFKNNTTQNIVANCHKLPANAFSKELLSLEKIISQLNTVIQELTEINENLKIIFTVSPIRHWNNGAIENQLSKAQLLVAVHEVKKQHKMVDYFPAYEIVMDDLRDYRFYAEDMFHLTTTTINYIFDKFSDCYIDKSIFSLIDQIKNINQAIQHRPTAGYSVQYKKFLLELIGKMKKIETQQNEISFTQEIEKIHQILNDKYSE